MGRQRLAGSVIAAQLTLLAMIATATAPAAAAGTSDGRVLLVGTFHGLKGNFSTIQAAVDTAKKGDWILIAPGDYHEVADEPQAAATSHGNHPTVAYSDGDFGGVLIDTPDITLRGINRSSVIVDGTQAGAPMPCDSAPQYQNFGPAGLGGAVEGRNGILVWKANGVSVENLTVCNFVAGAGDSGNEIWWNGGDGSGKIGLKGYDGSYLTATSTYFGGEKTAAQYGIFSSDSKGPGNWNHLYASNFNDSGMYVGACQQVCGMVIDDAWMEYNALGYSGTNSGGSIVVENSQFDNNEDGFDTNTQIGADPPAPGNGDCPGQAISPITHTRSCWVFMHNDIHDNNNINTPRAGSAAAGPTGTGMTISGARNDTVMDNTFANNGAWGILFVPYPDNSTPVLGQTCAGTGGVENSAFGCIYDPERDALLNNTFIHDGYFMNPSNSDYGQITFSKGEPQNCFAGNKAPQGSSPANLEKIQAKCGPTTRAANTGGPLLDQVLCDTGFGTCPASAHYPQPTGVVIHQLPKALRTMSDPCAGVPANAWCRDEKPI
ncbi:MAG: hypothetical protein ACRD6W_08780 [Nitrososphaerales archaeon]